MNAREALEKTQELIDADAIKCTDCGRTVDVSAVDSQLMAVAILSRHQKEYHE